MAGKLHIDIQVQGALETLMYLELDNANKVDRKLYDEKHAVERINTQRAIIETLQWVRDNRGLIVQVRYAQADALRTSADDGIED